MVSDTWGLQIRNRSVKNYVTECGKNTPDILPYFYKIDYFFAKGNCIITKLTQVL